MSIECGECERDLRGGHADDCSKNAINQAGRDRVEAALKNMQDSGRWDEVPSPMARMAMALLAADAVVARRKPVPVEPVVAPEFIAEKSLHVPGLGTVHVGPWPLDCKGVGSFVLFKGNLRRIRILEYDRSQFMLTPKHQVGMIFEPLTVKQINDLAMTAYHVSIADTPVHSNRYPIWSELDEATKAEWRRKVDVE